MRRAPSAPPPPSTAVIPLPAQTLTRRNLVAPQLHERSEDAPKALRLVNARRMTSTGMPARTVFELTATFRHLETPEPVEVECTGEMPRALWWRGRHVRVRHAIGPERLAGDWWKDPYARDYWRCEQDDPLAHLLVFRERRPPDGQWYVQGWYD